MVTTSQANHDSGTRESWLQRFTRIYRAELRPEHKAMERRLVVRFGLMFLFGLLLTIEEALYWR